MTETKKSWDFPVGNSNLITVFSGTRQLLTHVPNPKSQVIVHVTVTEIIDD